MLEVFFVFLTIAGLSLLIIGHELGHFLAAKWSGVLVEEFGFGFPPRIWGKKIGETVYSINWLPFGGFVRVYGESHRNEKSDIPVARSLSHQKPGKRFLISISGVLVNFLLGWILVSIVFQIGIEPSLLVTDIVKGSIAESSGIQKGDQLADFTKTEELHKFIDSHKGQEVILKVQRGKELAKIRIIPRADVAAAEGNLGFYFVETGLPKSGFWKSLGSGFTASVRIFFSLFQEFFHFITGIFTDARLMERIVGPVGIVTVAVQTTKLGAAHFIQLLALLSLNLAALNLIPIPALDGGRLLFIALEKIRGRQISPKLETMINSIGFAFIFLLIFVVTLKDIWMLF